MKIALILIAMIAASTVIYAAGENMNNQNDNDTSAWTDSMHVGQPVDIAPWTYAWRADLAVQSKPEAYFIPRRLDRLDKVYRTAYDALPPDQLKSIFYELPDLLKPLLPAPKNKLQAGLLWTGGLNDYRVELRWPSDAKTIPSPDAVEVRAYPTSWGWFGWVVDQILSKPVISDDGRTWTYKSDPTAKMDAAYNARVPAATEMVAVFYEKTVGKPVVPDIHIIGPSIGSWKKMDVEIEWGFLPGTEQKDIDARVEPYVAKIGPIAPLTNDRSTTITGKLRWESPAMGGERRGVVIPLLYAPDSTPGLDSRVTVWTAKSGFTFRISDLDKGPIFIPGQGVFITKSGSGQTGRRFAKELASKNLQSISQMGREHRETASWDELMQEVRLWTCPDGTAVPPLPKVPDSPMKVELSDQRWADAWRAASFQLQGEHMWGGLAFEVGRVAHDMDMIGLHKEADKVYEHFLKSPGAKSDGDYSDGKGALEWATTMRHDMGYSHDGTHASTGRLLFAMAERYFLTGDKEWFEKNRIRLQAAADWIIRQRTDYMKHIPNRKDLFVAGLMPPSMLGDYAIPTCDWHWYYIDNVLDLQGLQRFADALMVSDKKLGEKYQNEADAFRKDLKRVVEKDAALAPVRLGRDGTFSSFIPRMPYIRGLTGPEIGAPQFPDTDKFMGALPLAEPYAALNAGDYRMVDTLELMEEMGTSASAIKANEDARKLKGLPTDDAWFWTAFVILPKASHNANIYLLQDDIPNFLRFWMNSYASVVGADGKLWEHWHLGGYDVCTSPDNGTAGWFMENFRNMLVMEDGQSLWVARATPRAWLEQGKRIAIKDAPTCFGTLAYEIVSDVDNGKITATINIPNRNPLKSVIVRFRHPKSSPIKSVTVNGKPWKEFKPAKETIELKGLTGKAVVVASY
ncbi:MAG: hypothetical protein ACYC0V_08395 [Armatimonadota bacterium]